MRPANSILSWWWRVPEGYDPDPSLLAACEQHARIDRNPASAAEGAHLLVTDVWASMGQESEQAAREAVLAPYQLNRALLDRASSDALYMHCLPAHRGEEITAELMDAPDSVIWKEAENRLACAKSTDGVADQRLIALPESEAVGITVFSEKITEIFHAPAFAGISPFSI